MGVESSHQQRSLRPALGLCSLQRRSTEQGNITTSSSAIMPPPSELLAPHFISTGLFCARTVRHCILPTFSKTSNIVFASRCIPKRNCHSLFGAENDNKHLLSNINIQNNNARDDLFYCNNNYCKLYIFRKIIAEQ